MVRVRFAPSPTGFLHIGNARSAVINYLFAKKHDGEFILRLDDTDSTRVKKEYIDAIFEDLEWLGIKVDRHFKQSDRKARYDEVKEKLIEAKRLYPCDEEPAELELKRKQQLAMRKPPIYDRAALAKPPADLSKAHWRFLLSDKSISWHDLIRGSVTYPSKAFSDPILIRADGDYLYSLPSVVDDIDYAITHIIRGEDHVTNTALQIEMFQAIGNGLPEFAHFPWLVDDQGKGFSKRLGSLNLAEIKNKGILAITLVAFLARFGSKHSLEPFSTMDEVIANFDLLAFSRNTPKFNEDDLFNLQKHIMPRLSLSEVNKLLPQSITEDFWQLISHNITTLHEVPLWQQICFDDINIDADSEFKSLALECLPNIPWGQDTWKVWTENILSKSNFAKKELYQALRHVLTGENNGPKMVDLILFLGNDTVKRRLR